MGRKSSIDKLAGGVRAHIEKRLRENRLTLDELIDDLRAQFPADASADALPSRSALGRYRVSFADLSSRMREQDQMSRMLVAELGENPDERAGALMVQSVTALLTHASMTTQTEDAPDIDTIAKLARASRDVIQARKVSLDERRQIAKDAREKLIAEQEQRIEDMRGSDGMSEEFEARIRRILLGKA